MGLDMYLKAEKYLSDYSHNKNENERTAFKTVLSAVGLEGCRCEQSPSLTVMVTVAYWRKANAIHGWFVANVQDGKDECRASFVERKQLEELVKQCKLVLGSVETVEGDIGEGTTYYPDGRVENHTKRGKVVAQKAVAEEILPTKGGFFFGSTNYDEYYLADLEDTVKQLTAILENEALNGCEFYYRASW